MPSDIEACDTESLSSEDSLLNEKQYGQSLRQRVHRFFEQDKFLDTFVHYNFQVLHFLRPSFRQEKLNNIACLDGLRGVACFIVFNFHFLYPYTYTAIHGYGAKTDDGRAGDYLHWHQLPFLSLLYRGRAMVAIFFAISGYVLSQKFLRNANYKSLGSTAFRRVFRLYLPPTISTLLVLLATRIGLLNPSARVLDNKVTLPGEESHNWISAMPEPHPKIMETLSEQVVDYWKWWTQWVNPWDWDIIYGDYDPHTWTIPLEVRSSMVLFLVLIATAGLRPKWKLATITAFFFYCVTTLRWEVALFFGGIIVAQIDVFEFKPRRIQWLAFTAGLYLLSFPDVSGQLTPGFIFLSSITPEGYGWIYLFWHIFGSLLVIHSVTNLAALRKFFEKPIFQYFGQISFAFYLVHGPVLHIVGLPLMPRIWRITGYGNGYGGNIGFVTGLAMGYPILLLLSGWLADLFCRLVDVPCTRLSKKIETWISV